MSVYVWVCAHESSAFSGQKRAPDSPELKLQTVVKGHVQGGHWETNSQPLKEPERQLNVEPSPQFQN